MRLLETAAKVTVGFLMLFFAIPSIAGNVIQDAGWYAFCVGRVGEAIFDSNPVCKNQAIGLTSNTISFNATSKVELRVTDAFIAGESFRVMIDGRSRITSSTTPWGAINVFDPNSAFSDPRYSHGSWILDAGFHTVDIFALTTATDTGGAAYMEVIGAGSTPTNPVVNYDLKWWSKLYLDLFEQVQKDLVWIGDMVSIATGKSFVEVALNRLWKRTLEKLTVLTTDPRDEAAVELGKKMESTMKVAALLGGTGDQVAAGAAVAMSKITVNATVDALKGLYADPPRTDFSTVRMTSGPLTIPALDALVGADSFTNAQVALTKCSAGLLDGLQVALLASERAWGAYSASDANAMAAQNNAYGAGIRKANDQIDECAGVMNDLAASLITLGVDDIDLSSLNVGYGALTQADISSLRDKLLLANVFSADEIDAAMSYELNESAPTYSGRAFDVVHNYGVSLESMGALPDSLNVPEPNAIGLIGIGLAALAAVNGLPRRRRLNT